MTEHNDLHDDQGQYLSQQWLDEMFEMIDRRRNPVTDEQHEIAAAETAAAADPVDERTEQIAQDVRGELLAEHERHAAAGEVVPGCRACRLVEFETVPTVEPRWRVRMRASWPVDQSRSERTGPDAGRVYRSGTIEGLPEGTGFAMIRPDVDEGEKPAELEMVALEMLEEEGQSEPGDVETPQDAAPEPVKPSPSPRGPVDLGDDPDGDLAGYDGPALLPGVGSTVLVDYPEIDRQRGQVERVDQDAVPVTYHVRMIEGPDVGSVLVLPLIGGNRLVAPGRDLTVQRTPHQPGLPNAPRVGEQVEYLPYGAEEADGWVLALVHDVKPNTVDVRPYAIRSINPAGEVTAEPGAIVEAVDRTRIRAVAPASNMGELIEASSLGTPAAKAARESVPLDRARRVVERANAISEMDRRIALAILAGRDHTQELPSDEVLLAEVRRRLEVDGSDVDDLVEERRVLNNDLSHIRELLGSTLSNVLDPNEYDARDLAEHAARRIGELSQSYDKACQQVADMHAAAVGEVRAPIRGVVEDVNRVRAELDLVHGKLAQLMALRSTEYSVSELVRLVEATMGDLREGNDREHATSQALREHRDALKERVTELEQQYQLAGKLRGNLRDALRPFRGDSVDHYADRGLVANVADAVRRITLTPGIRELVEERHRQILELGWTAEHDNEHDRGDLAAAATYYLTGDSGHWPWGNEAPGLEPPGLGDGSLVGYVRRLAKAGALILAEIEREYRTSAVVPPEPRRCRECGCTDEDCSGCIERTGRPCSWVEADLCSACQQLAGQPGFLRAAAANRPAAETALMWLPGEAREDIPVAFAQSTGSPQGVDLTAVASRTIRLELPPEPPMGWLAIVPGDPDRAKPATEWTRVSPSPDDLYPWRCVTARLLPRMQWRKLYAVGTARGGLELVRFEPGDEVTWDGPMDERLHGVVDVSEDGMPMVRETGRSWWLHEARRLRHADQERIGDGSG